MALSQKALQKKRAKKNEKRKIAQKPAGLLGFAREWGAAASCPVADVLVPTQLFKSGIGNVWFSRRLPDGRYAMAAFLVDVFCLGVKDALFSIAEEHEYLSRLKALDQQFGEEAFSREHPAYARKLVEAAVEYAEQWGLEPHADYKIARLIFGDVDAAACPASFKFGQNGKPFYVCGPHDSPAKQRQICQRLEKRCGSGGFDFIASVDAME